MPRERDGAGALPGPQTIRVAALARWGAASEGGGSIKLERKDNWKTTILWARPLSLQEKILQGRFEILNPSLKNEVGILTTKHIFSLRFELRIMGLRLALEMKQRGD